MVPVVDRYSRRLTLSASERWALSNSSKAGAKAAALPSEASRVSVSTVASWYWRARVIPNALYLLLYWLVCAVEKVAEAPPGLPLLIGWMYVLPPSRFLGMRPSRTLSEYASSRTISGV